MTWSRCKLTHYFAAFAWRAHHLFRWHLLEIAWVTWQHNTIVRQQCHVLHMLRLYQITRWIEHQRHEKCEPRYWQHTSFRISIDNSPGCESSHNQNNSENSMQHFRSNTLHWMIGMACKRCLFIRCCYRGHRGQSADICQLEARWVRVRVRVASKQNKSGNIRSSSSSRLTGNVRDSSNRFGRLLVFLERWKCWCNEWSVYK